MTRLFLSVLTLFTLLLLFSCNENQLTAKQYHDEMYASVDTVVKYIFKLDNDIRSKSKNSKDSYNKLLDITNANLKYVEEKGSFENKDDKMQQASIQILTYYKDFTQDKFKLAVDIATKDSITSQEEDRMLEIISSFYDGESKYLDVFKKESYDFGDRYKIYKLQPSKSN